MGHKITKVGWRKDEGLNKSRFRQNSNLYLYNDWMLDNNAYDRLSFH